MPPSPGPGCKVAGNISTMELYMAQESLFIVEREEKAKMMEQLAGNGTSCILIKTLPAKAEVVFPSEDSPGNKREDYSFTLNPAEQHLADLLEESSDRPVYLAMDGDSRGRYWSWLLHNYIKLHHPAVNCQTIALRGLSPAEYSSALAEIGKSKVTTPPESTYIRSLFFSCLGGHLQRLIGTQFGPNKLPLHFNSLTTLFLLKNREDENRMYSPLLQWHAAAQLKLTGRELRAQCKGRAGKPETGLESEEQGRALEKKVVTSGLSVTKIERKKLILPSHVPYMLAELLQAAHAEHRISPKTTLQSLRNLFYGISGEETGKGLISWFLPGNGLLSDDTLDLIDDYVVELFGENALSDKLPHVPDGAIVALWPEITAADLAGASSKQEQLLYEMIRIRTLACRMRPAGGQSILCAMQCEDYTFEVSDQQIEEEGFLAVCDREKGQFQLEESPLLKVEEGQVIPVAAVSCEHKILYPPEPYAFESLFADLADFSITVDDGLVLMLQTMVEAGYISLDEKGFVRTSSLCQKVVNVLNRAFPSMQGINLSAYLEQTTQEVISGRKGLAFALKQFDQTLNIYGKPQVSVSISSASIAKLQKKRQGRVSSSVIKTAEIPADKKAPASVDEPPLQPPVDGKAPVLPAEETCQDMTQPVGLDAETVSLEQRNVAVEGEDTVHREEGHAGEAPEQEGLAGQLQPAMEEEAFSTMHSPEDSLSTEEESAEEQRVFAEQEQGGEPGIIPAEEQQAIPLPVAAALAAEEKAASRPCAVCGRPMILRSDQYGRFYTCTGFPACRYAEPEKGQEQEQMQCPVCIRGKVHTKVTPTGKMLYVCSESDCEFMAWAKPHAVPCPSCGSSFLVEKKLLAGALELRCPRAGCNFRQPLSPVGEGTANGRQEVSADRRKKVRIRRVAGGLVASGGKKKVVRVVRRRK